MVYKYFDKKCSSSNTSGSGVNSEIMLNQKLPEELHKAIVGKFEKQKVCSSFRENIWMLILLIYNS